MLSLDAKNGFDDMLNVCLRESLKTTDHSEWTIRSEDKKAINEKEIFMLTISSHDFRIFLVLHFSKNEKTTAYVANALKVAPENLDATRYYDFLGEIGNSFCGIYKRELGKYFPHLGMSTPNLMVSETMQHLAVWDYAHESHWKAKSQDEVNFHGSVMVSSFGEVDFKYKANSLDEDVETGALEFF